MIKNMAHPALTSNIYTSIFELFIRFKLSQAKIFSNVMTRDFCFVFIHRKKNIFAPNFVSSFIWTRRISKLNQHYKETTPDKMTKYQQLFLTTTILQ